MPNLWGKPAAVAHAPFAAAAPTPPAKPGVGARPALRPAPGGVTRRRLGGTRAHRYRLPAAFLAWAGLALALSGCGLMEALQPSPTPTPTAPPPTPTAVPTPTPTPEPSRLTICTGSEPDSLYVYSSAMYVADLIRQAIYDGPIDTRSYELQPVILEKIPTLEDGDATLETVSVEAGMPVVDASGQVITLAEGALVLPAGCRDLGCAVTYAGGPILMDRLAVTFRLLPGVTWSDGQPLTAEDSVFSFEIARHPATPYSLGGLPGQHAVDPAPRTESYTALDARTVRWVGLPGFVDPAYRTNFWIPLPRHALQGRTAEALIEAGDTARRPLGWGPYVVSRWEPGRQIVAERNPNYFRAAEGLPRFDQVIFRFLNSQDPAVALGELERGGCDILTLDTGLEADLDGVLERQDRGVLVLHANPGTAWEQLSFAINPSPDHARPDLFEDVRLRQAVAMCLDRADIVNSIFRGLTSVPAAYVPAEHPLVQGVSLPAQAYDPAGATALLDQIGWVDTNGDGIREAQAVEGIPNGTPLRFTLDTTTSETRGRVAAMIAEDLRACGMEVVVSQRPPGELFVDGPAGPLLGRRFDVAEFAWVTGPTPPCELFLSTRIPSEADGWTGANITGYTNPGFDAACDAARRALPGTAEFDQGHLAALQIFAEDVPAVPLFLRMVVSASRPDITGLIVDPTLREETWNIEAFARSP
jgi:peptide/nickel transport system substrate-binding protein